MDIFENLHKVNEQEDLYRNSVELSIDFIPPAPGVAGLDDDYYIEAPDNIDLQFDLDVEYRSWGVKDINVFLRGILDFEITIRSNLPEEENKEVVIPVMIDFSEVKSEITWLEGSGIAPAELHVTLDGNKVTKVEVDFYYWKP